MEIIHNDKGGKPWVFSIDCTPYQAELLKRTLTGVRDIGNREQLALRYYDDYEANELFCRTVERAILQGLAASFPTGEDTHQGQEPTAPQQPAVIDEEPQPGYYWENF